MFDFLSQNSSPFRKIETKVPITKLMLEDALKASELFCASSGSISFQRASTLEGVIVLLSYGLYRIDQYSDKANLWKAGLIRDMSNLVIDQMRESLSLHGYVQFDDFAKNRFSFADLCLRAMIEGDGSFLQTGLTKLVLQHPFIDLEYEVDSEDNLLISEKYVCQDFGKVIVFTDNLVSAIKRYDKTCDVFLNIMREREGW